MAHYVLVNKDTNAFVSGVNQAYQIVQMTSDCSRAKKFKNQQGAQEFLDTYADAGYGLVSAKTSITPVN